MDEGAGDRRAGRRAIDERRPFRGQSYRYIFRTRQLGGENRIGKGGPNIRAERAQHFVRLDFAIRRKAFTGNAFEQAVGQFGEGRLFNGEHGEIQCERSVRFGDEIRA